MKTFDYTKPINSLLLDDFIKCLGKMEFIQDSFPKILNAQKENAMFNESYFSTKIEGIILEYDKCKKMFSQIEHKDIKGKPGDVSDFDLQFQGYSKILLTINRRLDFFNIDTTSILAMFYALFNIPADYKKSVYRKTDVQEMINGKQIVQVRVSPVDAYETPLYIGAAANALASSFQTHPNLAIINIAKFLVDFMCIRPFDAGCGRIARLFTYLLLLKSNVDIVKYISLSEIFEHNAAKYYESISLCCKGWDKDNNTYQPFIDFFLDCLIKAYNKLFEKTKISDGKKLNKTDRIFEYIKKHPKRVTKKQLKESHPDISLSTIENALFKLKNENKIKQCGGGRSTFYSLV